MTDDGDRPRPPRRRPGRPPNNETALPSAEAGAAARTAIRTADLTQAAVAEQMHVSERKLGRWLKGQSGPTVDEAEDLARLLDAPHLVDLWWPDESTEPVSPVDRVTSDSAAPVSPAGADLPPSPDRSDPPATSAAPTEPSPAGTGLPNASRARRGRLIALVVGALVLVAGVVVWIQAAGNDDENWTPAGPRSAPASSAPAAVDGPISAQVIGSFAGFKSPAKTIGLWTKPGMNMNCELSPCPPGTVQGGRVQVGATITVECVAEGQMLRNGASGESGYFEDRRWLRLAPGQEVEPTGDGDLYLSNLWFLRDDLPALPAC